MDSLKNKVTWKDVIDAYKFPGLPFYDKSCEIAKSVGYRYILFNGAVYSVDDKTMTPICQEEELVDNIELINYLNERIDCVSKYPKCERNSLKLELYDEILKRVDGIDESRLKNIKVYHAYGSHFYCDDINEICRYAVNHGYDYFSFKGKIYSVDTSTCTSDKKTFCYICDEMDLAKIQKST